MRLNEPEISILVGAEETTIELHDGESAITFAKVKLTSEQLSKALSRIAHVECKEISVFGLDNINKKHECKSFDFEIPTDLAYDERKNVAAEISTKKCPEGWKPDSYFGSKNSFYEKDGKSFARCTIRRWV